MAGRSLGIAESDLTPAHSTVKIDFDGEEFTFERAATEAGKPRDKVVSSKVV